MIEDDGTTPKGGDAPSAERALRDELRRRDEVISGLRAALAARQEALTAIQTSLGWRVVRRLRLARDRAFANHPRARSLLARWVPGVLRAAARRGGAAEGAQARYARWVQTHASTAESLAVMQSDAGRRPERPAISIVVTARAGDGALVARTLASLRSQVWERWEAILPGGKEIADAVESILPRDPRVHVSAPDHAAGTTRVAATGGGHGEFVALLAAGDELAPEALCRLAVVANAMPDADVIYSDEDELDGQGRRCNPFFKPEWSPDLLLSMNYFGQLVAYRREIFDAIHCREALASADPYDLALRATERARRIVHVAEVLCHRRAAALRAPDAAVEAGQRALVAAVSRRGFSAAVERAFPTAMYRVRYEIVGRPLVSIVVPSRDRPDLLRACVDSIEERSTWKHRELIVVDNGSTRPAALRLLSRLEGRCQILRDARPFNWSALNNAAARTARGEYLLFLNDDVEVITPGWIEALLEHAQRASVGAVGAKLIYPDGTVQHAGIVLGVGVAAHPFRGLPADAPGHHGLALAVRNVSAVTGACMLVRRDVFERVGGFDERLPVAFNDVDFCLRLREGGLLVVWTPHATLVHRESATRGTLHPAAAEVAMWERWATVLAHDPYYNRQLTRAREDYTVDA